VRYRGYRRSEIVNHLGVQYDPARHNTGVIRVDRDIALLTQLDTRDARDVHHYQNRSLEDLQHISWETKHRQVMGVSGPCARNEPRRSGGCRPRCRGLEDQSSAVPLTLQSSVIAPAPRPCAP